MTEQWRAIVEAPGYEVSSSGRVGSWLPGRNNAPLPTTRRVLKASRDKDGYARVTIRRDGVRLRRRVCRLVATAWHGQPNGKQVRHLDGDNTNDHPSNLAWGTAKENSADKKRHKTQVLGTQINTAKLTEEKVREIKNSDKGHSELARKYGTSPGAIWHIRAERTWKHVSP